MNRKPFRYLFAFSIACIGFIGVPQFTLAKETQLTQVLITNVNIFDGNDEKLATGLNLLVEGNKIKKISQTAIKTHAEATVLDGQGKTLTPGLIDMHQHIMLTGGTQAGTYEYDAYTQGARGYKAMIDNLLMRGVTTIRDIAGNTLGLARAIRAGLLPGPRIYTSGPALSTTGGHGDWGSYNDQIGQKDYQELVFNTVIADGRAEVLKAARQNFRNGASFIKVMAGGGVASQYDPLEMSGYTFEELKAIVQVAEDYESYVTVHAYHDRSYNRAMDAGVKMFEHGFLISEDTVKRMKKEGAIFSFQPFGGYTMFGGSFPDWFTPNMIKKGKRVHQGTARVAKWMKQHDVFMVLGSDMFGDDSKYAIDNVIAPVTIPGAGYTSFDCMKMSTGNAGKVLAMSGPARDYYKEAKLGVIEEGAWADLLIYEGNPVENIKIIREDNNLKLIMKDGVIYKNTL
ncbi:MAG: amidohydrolase family protein [Nitrospirota bacterium]|nr:MAG: amidohydrolase family protein [Nitrospirota bacterium]